MKVDVSLLAKACLPATLRGLAYKPSCCRAQIFGCFFWRDKGACLKYSRDHLSPSSVGESLAEASAVHVFVVQSLHIELKNRHRRAHMFVGWGIGMIVRLLDQVGHSKECLPRKGLAVY